MTESDDLTDRVERSIDIDAPAEKVWELLRQPGWWINDGEIVPQTAPPDDGGVHVVHHPEQGTFRFSAVHSDPPRYLSYRWHDAAAEDATLVEFFVEARRGGVTLRVVESGIRGLSRPAAAVERYVDEHTAGWEAELQAADRYLVAS
jgi:uncharacterized protein YndB with AHSA1/START domain